MLTAVDLVQRVQQARHCAITGEYETAKVYYDMSLAMIDQLRAQALHVDTGMYRPSERQLLVLKQQCEDQVRLALLFVSQLTTGVRSGVDPW